VAQGTDFEISLGHVNQISLSVLEVGQGGAVETDPKGEVGQLGFVLESEVDLGGVRRCFGDFWAESGAD
jgi:hypothetical protein